MIKSAYTHSVYEDMHIWVVVFIIQLSLWFVSMSVTVQCMINVRRITQPPKQDGKMDSVVV